MGLRKSISQRWILLETSLLLSSKGDEKERRLQHCVANLIGRDGLPPLAPARGAVRVVKPVSPASPDVPEPVRSDVSLMCGRSQLY
jgi:hypothetical protein